MYILSLMFIVSLFSVFANAIPSQNLTAYFDFDNDVNDSVSNYHWNNSLGVASTTQGIINGAYSYIRGDGKYLANVVGGYHPNIPNFNSSATGFTINYWFNKILAIL